MHLAGDGLQLAEMVRLVEQRLAHFYGFLPLARAADHLLTRGELGASLGSQEATLPALNGRAAVLISRDSPEDLFIGIYFADAIFQRLAERDPFRLLNGDNLDEFCILIEEVSHFHLLLNRAAAGLEVSKLELECQGEIDKLLLAALLLEEQCGDLHLLPLARKLYDQAQIISEEHDLYWQATRHAARFWFDLLRQNRPFDEGLRRLLQVLYRCSWAGKLELFETARRRAS